MDSDANIEWTDERILDFVEERLATIGVEHAFRDLDATDIDSKTIEMPGGNVVSPEPFGFEIAVDALGRDTLEWQTERLCSQLSEFAWKKLANAGLTTVAELKDAHVSKWPAVVLPGLESGVVGEMPFSCDLVSDKRTMPPGTALVANRETFGFVVDRQYPQVKRWEEPQRDQEMVQVKLRRGYTVEKPNAGRLVDLS